MARFLSFDAAAMRGQAGIPSLAAGCATLGPFPVGTPVL